MALKTSFGGGKSELFKVKDHLSHLAVLIEPTGSREVVSKKFGSTDTWTDADITLFPSAGSLEGKEEPIVKKGITIPGGVLARDMAKEIGDQCFGKLVQKPSEKGNPFVCLEGIGDPAMVNAVSAYIEKRDAAEQAERSAALASDDTPDFLK